MGGGALLGVGFQHFPEHFRNVRWQVGADGKGAALGGGFPGIGGLFLVKGRQAATEVLVEQNAQSKHVHFAGQWYILAPGVEAGLRGEIDLVAHDLIIQSDGVRLQEAAVEVDELGCDAAGGFGEEDIGGFQVGMDDAALMYRCQSVGDDTADTALAGFIHLVDVGDVPGHGGDFGHGHIVFGADTEEIPDTDGVAVRILVQDLVESGLALLEFLAAGNLLLDPLGTGHCVLIGEFGAEEFLDEILLPIPFGKAADGIATIQIRQLAGQFIVSKSLHQICPSFWYRK